MPRDPARWPLTDGFPPIIGGSGAAEGNEEGEEQSYLTAQEAAERLGVTVQRVHGLVAEGKLPAEKRKVKVVEVVRTVVKLFIPASAVDAYNKDPIRRFGPKRRRGRPR